MRKYILIFCFVSSIFGLLSCEDEDPITASLNYITACNEAQFDIQFYNTHFWDSDIGQWYDLNWNGNKVTNPITGTDQFCRKYIDESTIDPNDPFGSIDSELTNNSEVKVEINSNGETDVTLKCTDIPEDAGLGSGTFLVEIELDNIDSYSVNTPHTVENFMNVFVGGEFWNATYIVTFTQIDPINHIYVGTASAIIDWWSPIHDYEPGTSPNFTCDITFSFDKL